MQPQEYPPLINRKQASRLTGLSDRQFDLLRKKGVLSTYTTTGGLHRFYRDEVLKHCGLTLEEKHYV
jgi:DNA-binding transcriptional MerR regulator